MLRYVIRRILYAVPILIGVLLLTFFLFFGTQSPETIARRNLSSRNPTQAQIKQWLDDHGYNKPIGEQLKRSTVDMLAFNFGKSDASQEDIWTRVKQGAGPSGVIGGLIFISSVSTALFFAIAVAYFRGTYIDSYATAICVLLMSINAVVYVIALQFFMAKMLRYGPVWGYDPDSLARFVLIPVVVGVMQGLGSEVRLYRTFLLDEINQDYVRTARAKGVPEAMVLLKHVLKNSMIPLITSNVSAIPRLILGSILIESFFGIPGLGNYLVDAITSQDFAIIRAMVFLGTLLYIVGNIITDVCYALVDPRIRLE
ncbi:MAG: ABC transporter permease [Fibrella sp.]|nr:ABC transporter permease [Armatimonadota bacterium]